MGILSTLLTIAGGVWGMGGNLRLIYERSADSRQQSEDRLQTLQRVIAFGAWVVAIVSYEAYLVELRRPPHCRRPLRATRLLKTPSPPPEATIPIRRGWLLSGTMGASFRRPTQQTCD